MSSEHQRWLPLLLALVACGSDPPTGAIGSADGGATDASTDSTASSEAGSTPGICEGPCRVTSLTFSFAGKTEPLTRAQFGFFKKDGGSMVLHLEAHDGGSSACPTSSSPTPDRTLVIEDLPEPREGVLVGSADGVRAAFFDFEGTLLPSPLAKATTVSLRPAAIERDAQKGDLAAFALEVTMTFPQGGTLSGHLFAEHCASMDE